MICISQAAENVEKHKKAVEEAAKEAAKQEKMVEVVKTSFACRIRK